MSDVKSFQPSAEDLARLADGSISPTMRAKLLAHIAESSESAEAVKVAIALESEVREFSEALANDSKAGSDGAQGNSRWFQQWAVAATIVVAAGVGFWILPSSEPEPVVLRGASAEVNPKPGAQLQTVPSEFTWSNPNPGQFLLLDSLANPIFEATAEEGRILVQGELAHVLSSGGQFLWRVDIDGRTLGPYPIEVVSAPE